jgi:trans-aconitate 2-methyltransferase
VTTRWDPGQYLQYEDERGRPFVDLLNRVSHGSPERIVDLGCGPGNTTVQLLQRWPEATVVGIDSSADMIERAKHLAVPGRLDFVRQDLRDWNPDTPVDVLLCCATFQWVEGHADLFQGFVDVLAPGGVFAFQVPGNFPQPSHTLLYELASSDRWRELLGPLVRPNPVLEPDGYLSAMLDTGANADVWETTYLHILTGPDPVLEWVRGTGLRPFIDALEQSNDADDLEAFLTSYAAVLRAAYPKDGEGRTIFPFRRIFGVARKADRSAERPA